MDRPSNKEFEAFFRYLQIAESVSAEPRDTFYRDFMLIADAIACHDIQPLAPGTLTVPLLRMARLLSFDRVRFMVRSKRYRLARAPMGEFDMFRKEGREADLLGEFVLQNEGLLGGRQAAYDEAVQRRLCSGDDRTAKRRMARS